MLNGSTGKIDSVKLGFKQVVFLEIDSVRIVAKRSILKTDSANTNIKAMIAGTSRPQFIL